MITEDTRRRLGDPFKLEELGPQTLKNVPHPVRIYRVLEELAAAITPEGASGPPADYPAIPSTVKE
jgi:class 3 adenylate cyclase